MEQMNKALEVMKYEAGTDKHIDEVLVSHETCWLIRGPQGLRTVLAHTEEEARQRYVTLCLL
jgi:hypothetical protein